MGIFSRGLKRRLRLLPLVLLLNKPALAAPDDSALDCLIQPDVVVDVSSPVEGVIEDVTVDRSALVKKGQPLAALEARVERAAVEQARARAQMDGEVKAKQAALDFARRKLQRVDELFDKKAISSNQKDETETEARLAEMELRQAQENKRLAELELERAVEMLSLRTVRSPIDGVVVERYLSPGEFVDKKPILRLARIDPLRVEVIVPAALFGSLQPGMPAQVTPEAPGDGIHTATVTIVDRVVDASSGTFGVRLELPNPDYRLPGGLKCRVRFPLLAEQAAPAPGGAESAAGRASTIHTNNTTQVTK